MKNNLILFEALTDYENYCELLRSHEELKEYSEQAAAAGYEYFITPLKLSGKTYQERKATIQDQAITYSNVSGANFSMMDLCEIHAYFEKYGKKYGLIEEFRENAII